MRKLLVVVAICGLASSPSRSSQAQQFVQGANAASFGVAVVDISYIFKNYPPFTQAIDGLKKEMEAADGALKADRDKIVAAEEQRNALKAGTPEFKKLDESLAQQKAAFSIKQGSVRRDFLEKEAKIYFQTYDQVAAAVKSYATQNKIGMVLRFNGDAIDPTQREDVMRAIMQPIVFQNSIDITPDVLLTMGVDVRKLPAPQQAQPAAGPVAGRVQPSGSTIQR
ncbi:MAG: hypothetical protein DCC67_03555 [Planctomycetota bacterium]|nr:MAG: hypothetical protein DCC67_03555 [Planctomycetota bacterium]